MSWEHNAKHKTYFYVYTFILLDVTNNKDDKNDSFFEKVMPPNSTDLKQLLCHAWKNPLFMRRKH